MASTLPIAPDSDMELDMELVSDSDMEPISDSDMEPISDSDMEPISDSDENELKRALCSQLSEITTDHRKAILKLKTLKQAHMYCVVHRIPSQRYGVWLEEYIRKEYHYIKNKASDGRGDGHSGTRNIEIKVSLGGATHTHFNYVQLRLFQDCDYLLTAYHVSEKNMDQGGQLYLFRIPHDEMQHLVQRYGHYAHGTKTTIKKETVEYALRPKLNDNCWKALLPFQDK